MSTLVRTILGHAHIIVHHFHLFNSESVNLHSADGRYLYVQ